ncbi:ribonuclease E [Enhydrobacter aerosaccus]|uniref:Ribonuclease E n=1 Tax=Enhydrobacter aerosaccus TaxID=225324 RepID=A0A1T4ML78_9HYPH|nr:ribonuclease E/G [Enhydrobacter aerosaccus]SJZ67789.1 ribonuclease E [Enhydrobacter aerosaccus]
MTRIDRLICQVLPHAFILALVAEGRLVELRIARRDKPSLTDGIFLGRLERVMPELGAAFVDIGIGRSGFLRAEDRAGIDGWPPAGAPVLVQVRNEGDGIGDKLSAGKGPRLSMNIAVSGRYLVYHPLGSGVAFSRRIEGEAERERLAGHVRDLLEGGLVLRTAAAGASSAVLRADAHDVLERWEVIRRHALDLQPPADLTARLPRERDPITKVLRDHGVTLEEIVIDDRGLARKLQDEMDKRQETIRVRWHNGPMPVFDIDDVAGQIDTALAARIALESGVEVLFEPGETLTAIDVDSSRAGGRQGRAPRRPVDINLEAAPAIAQQLRLRNLAGAVVVDFVTMRSAYDRDKVQAVLAEALADDAVPTQLYGFTRLGLFELTRARRGATLRAQLEALHQETGEQTPGEQTTGEHTTGERTTGEQTEEE